MPVQSKNIRSMDLESRIKNHLSRTQKRSNPYLAVINRLDQPVEGLVLFAKTKQAAARLSRQLQEGEIEKYYLAVTAGNFDEREGVLTDELIKDSKTNCSRVATAGENGKKSMLKYQVAQDGENEQLLFIQLFTGRHHQIRVQLSHAGHAIWGDAKYNPEFGNHKETVQTALCAFRLEFNHPVSGERLRYQIKPKGNKFSEFTYCEKLEEII